MNLLRAAERLEFGQGVGNDLPLRWSQQRMYMAMDNLRGFVPDGLLGRLSVISSDFSEAFCSFIFALLI